MCSAMGRRTMQNLNFARFPIVPFFDLLFFLSSATVFCLFVSFFCHFFVRIAYLLPFYRRVNLAMWKGNQCEWIYLLNHFCSSQSWFYSTFLSNTRCSLSLSLSRMCSHACRRLFNLPLFSYVNLFELELWCVQLGFCSIVFAGTELKWYWNLFGFMATFWIQPQFDGLSNVSTWIFTPFCVSFNWLLLEIVLIW